MGLLITVAFTGCALRETRFDEDAPGFGRAWETPRLDQQPVLLDFKTEGVLKGDLAPEGLKAAAINILVDSGKFRPASTTDEPAYKIELTVRVHVERRWVHSVAGALVLYLWPTQTEDYVCEAFGAVLTPSGKLIQRCYAQTRGGYTTWAGYLAWPIWWQNPKTVDVIHRDALKAVTVKMCRALMPKAKL